MSWKFSDFCTVSFMFCFSVFMAFHFAYMKTPAQDRYVASAEYVSKPWYDASWKI